MNLILKKPKAIIFDWDNTLVDTEHITLNALNKTFKKFDKPTMTFEEFECAPALSAKKVFPFIFGEKHSSEAEKCFNDALHETHLDDLKLFNGAYEAIKEVNRNGLITGIVSSKYGPTLRKEVEHLGLSKYFKDIIGSTDTVEDKPSIEPVKKILQKTNIEIGQEVWFVGDSIVDMQCAENGNLTPIFRGCENSAKKQGLTNPLVYKMKNIKDLPSLLKKVI